MSGRCPQKARTRIAEVLGDCVYHTLGLKESLRDERSALEEQDADALHDAVATKSQCVNNIQKLEEQRVELCEASGFHAGSLQMEQMFNWCDENVVISNCSDHLLEIAAECNALNLTNGAIINARRHNIESRLAVLRGTDQDSDTYQRSGSGNSGANKRSLAQA